MLDYGPALMGISKNLDFRLKLGNLFLALLFSIVPTSMTIGFLATHGYLLCRDLDLRLEKIEETSISELCDRSNLDVNFNYILWVWLFITIPTWRWFYIGHYRRVSKNKKI